MTTEQRNLTTTPPHHPLPPGLQPAECGHRFQDFFRIGSGGFPNFVTKLTSANALREFLWLPHPHPFGRSGWCDHPSLQNSFEKCVSPQKFGKCSCKFFTSCPKNSSKHCSKLSITSIFSPFVMKESCLCRKTVTLGSEKPISESIWMTYGVSANVQGRINASKHVTHEHTNTQHLNLQRDTYCSLNTWTHERGNTSTTRHKTVPRVLELTPSRPSFSHPAHQSSNRFLREKFMTSYTFYPHSPLTHTLPSSAKGKLLRFFAPKIFTSQWTTPQKSCWSGHSLQKSHVKPCTNTILYGACCLSNCCWVVQEVFCVVFLANPNPHFQQCNRLCLWHCLFMLVDMDITKTFMDYANFQCFVCVRFWTMFSLR